MTLLLTAREMVVAMGLDNPWQIAPCHIAERLNYALADSIDTIYGFLEPGQLLDDPGSTQYRRFWAAAQAASFGEAPCPHKPV